MIREIVSLLYLSAAGFIDYRKKSIPFYLPALGLISGIVLYILQQDMQMKEVGISILPGMVFIGISLMSSGKVGLGDGLIMIPFGLLMGFWDSTTSLIYAMLFSGAVALFLLATKKRAGNYRLPFLPSLLCGLVLTLCIKTTQ